MSQPEVEPLLLLLLAVLILVLVFVLGFCSEDAGVEAGSLKERTETAPSEEAQARCAPSSCGDQARLLTEAVCRAKSMMRVQVVDVPVGDGVGDGVSRWSITAPE